MQDNESVRNKIAPTGALRAAINLGNPVLAQRLNNGSLDGVSVRLAKKLAQLLNVKLEIVVFDAAGKVVKACVNDIWDVGFLAIDPKRSETIKFTMPYVIIEGTYLVEKSSKYNTVSELDHSGSKISVGKGAAYDLFLSRNLKKAEIVRAPTSSGAVDMFLHDNLTAAAGVRQPLEEFANAHPNYRVIEDSFTQIEQAMAVPSGRGEAMEFLMKFVQERLDDGFITEAFSATGQNDINVPS